VLEIMRVADNGATVIALFNLSDTEQVIDYDARGCRELITGATINSDSLILAPWKAMWLSKA